MFLCQKQGYKHSHSQKCVHKCHHTCMCHQFWSAVLGESFCKSAICHRWRLWNLWICHILWGVDKMWPVKTTNPFLLLATPARVQHFKIFLVHPHYGFMCQVSLWYIFQCYSRSPITSVWLIQFNSIFKRSWCLEFSTQCRKRTPTRRRVGRGLMNPKIWLRHESWAWVCTAHSTKILIVCACSEVLHRKKNM